MSKPAWRKNDTRLPGASTKPYTLWKAHGFLRKEWMFSLNCFNPHHPFDPPAEYLERYLNRLDEIPLPNYEEGELNNKPVFQQKDHEGAYDTKDYYAYEKHPAASNGAFDPRGSRQVDARVHPFGSLPAEIQGTKPGIRNQRLENRQAQSRPVIDVTALCGETEGFYGTYGCKKYLENGG
ncbi:hypothetical protein [Eisenbergiella porci]|uniref:hypothetical protein n=2 Tax=Lachnospiraceae TaxID=186803 RepID=UPI001A9B5D07|nr:hypothetical protein [Eisenbergiella porci]